MLNSTLGGGEWSASRTAALLPEVELPVHIVLWPDGPQRREDKNLLPSPGMEP
jgi:hypothetical protein